jgi:hypothetical protein
MKSRQDLLFSEGRAKVVRSTGSPTCPRVTPLASREARMLYLGEAREHLCRPCSEVAWIARRAPAESHDSGSPQ